MKRTSLYILLLFGLLWRVTVLGAAAQQEESWSQPVNLSRSGSASQPRILAVDGGHIQVFWWDQFDGLTISSLSNDSWSPPATAGISARSLTAIPTLAVDSQGWVHAFWINQAHNNSLYYSKAGLGGENWSNPTSLANNVHQFQVSTSATGGLSASFLVSDPNNAEASGIYYLHSAGGDNSWDLAKPVALSPYFRVLDANQNDLTLADADNQRVIAAWEDPHTHQILSVQSIDQGNSWSVPQAASFANTGGSLPTLVALPNGEVLWIEKATESIGCGLTQKRWVPKGETISWSDPVPILSDLSACPEGSSFFSDQGKVYWVWGAGSEQLNVSQLDLNSFQWSPPATASFRFQDVDTGQTLTLTDLQAAVIGSQLVAVGSDGSGDVWTSETAISSLNFTQAGQPIWSQPVSTSLDEPMSEAPALAVDGQGDAHLVWSQADSAQQGSNSLFYTGWISNTNSLSSPATILTLQNGESAQQPDLLVGKDGQLHLVWSGGPDGRIFYSQASPQEARIPGGWSPPQAITPSNLARNPQILEGADGTLYVSYSLPVNEERGAYVVISKDGGRSWLAPVEIFNGAGAAWPMVGALMLAPASPQSLFAVWARYPLPWSEVPESLSYAISKDGGASWSPANLFLDVPISWSRLLSTHQQALHFLWIERANSKLIKHQVSMDGGAGWQPADNLYLPEGSLGQPSVTVDPAGQLHLVGYSQSASGEGSWNTWSWSETGWTPEEAFRLPMGDVTSVTASNLGMSTGGKLVVAYAGETAGQGNALAQAKLFLASRMEVLPANLPMPVPVTTRADVTELPTTVPTLAFIPTPTATQLPISVLSGGPPPSSGFLGSSYGGLILGAGIAALIVAVFFGVWSIRERLYK